MEKSINLPVFSVSDFIAVVNQTFEYAYPSVEVEGEVASFKVNQNKFIFFDIKDKGGSLNCFMTVWQLRIPIEDGMKVIVTATPKITQWGKFSLTVKSARPSGEGAIKKSFDLLKDKLSKEGLFSIERKRQLPYAPSNVAVISSIQAAGYADFIKIINDRWGGMVVDVANVQVQGVGAPDQIISAIEYFNQRQILPDVLVIIRGGGSADDLSSFNDELLARAIASSRIPTLVGVGHETDETLADLVADVRASTPSNAAQILVPDRMTVASSIHNMIEGLLPRINYLLGQHKTMIVNDIECILDKIDSACDDQIFRISNFKNILCQVNPNKVLARGYAIIRGVIKDNSMIEAETNKLIIKAEVKNVISK